MIKTRYMVIGGLIVAVSLWWASAQGPLRNPDEALRDFYEPEPQTFRPEPNLADPLIVNGRRVVPLILRDLPNREMPKRRYAIGFLGNGRYEEALPYLEDILADDVELHYFRADALAAIYDIAPDQARTLAATYTDRNDTLGISARSIEDGEDPNSWSRSYLQAALSMLLD